MKDHLTAVTCQRIMALELVALVVALFSLNQSRAEVWPHERTEPVAKEGVPFAQRVDPEVDRQMRSLEWRCVGPFVGRMHDFIDTFTVFYPYFFYDFRW